jgi:hypothetical protein
MNVCEEPSSGAPLSWVGQLTADDIQLKENVLMASLTCRPVSLDWTLHGCAVQSLEHHLKL